MRNKAVWGWVGVATALLLSSSSVTASSDRRLIDATKQQNHAAVSALLKQGVDLNARDADGSTALHWAAQRDDSAIADLLIRAGALIDTTNDYGATPLLLGAANGNPAMIERLLKGGANANAAFPTGETALMAAARAGHAEAVKLLLTSGADINAKETSNGQSALMWAVSERHADVVRVLIAGGADVRARTKAAFTPLLFAARVGDIDTARMLLDAGADVNEEGGGGAGGESAFLQATYKPRDTGFTPLVVATVRGHVGLATFLLERGANPNANAAGFTALHWAAGTWEGRYTGAGGFEGNQLLMPRPDDEWYQAAGLQTRKVEFVKALLAAGADPNARVVVMPRQPSASRGNMENRNIVGATPFFLAARSGDTAIMRILVAAGADPHLGTVHNPTFGAGGLGATGNFGALFAAGNVTPLMAAAGVLGVPGETIATNTDALEAVKYVLELGGDVNAVSDAGDTALHGAAHMRRDAVIQVLAERGAKLDVKNVLEQPPLYIAERTLQVGGIDSAARTSTGDLLRKLGADQALAASAAAAAKGASR